MSTRLNISKASKSRIKGPKLKHCTELPIDSLIVLVASHRKNRREILVEVEGQMRLACLHCRFHDHTLPGKFRPKYIRLPFPISHFRLSRCTDSENAFHSEARVNPPTSPAPWFRKDQLAFCFLGPNKSVLLQAPSRLALP